MRVLIFKKYWFVRICILVITLIILTLVFNYYKFKQTETMGIISMEKVTEQNARSENL